MEGVGLDGLQSPVEDDGGVEDGPRHCHLRVDQHVLRRTTEQPHPLPVHRVPQHAAAHQVDQDSHRLHWLCALVPPPHIHGPEPPHPAVDAASAQPRDVHYGHHTAGLGGLHAVRGANELTTGRQHVLAGLEARVEGGGRQPQSARAVREELAGRWRKREDVGQHREWHCERPWCGGRVDGNGGGGGGGGEREADGQVVLSVVQGGSGQR